MRNPLSYTGVYKSKFPLASNLKQISGYRLSNELPMLSMVLALRNRMMCTVTQSFLCTPNSMRVNLITTEGPLTPGLGVLMEFAYGIVVGVEDGMGRQCRRDNANLDYVNFHRLNK
jgi:hypothetical protein